MRLIRYSLYIATKPYATLLKQYYKSFS